jgi:hypothetical protein
MGHLSNRRPETYVAAGPQEPVGAVA